MAGHRWTLWNPDTETTISLPINPREGALPAREKTVTVETSTMGSPVLFEGKSKPVAIRVNGFLQLEAHHEFMNAWYDLQVAVMITDDLGQRFWCYMTKFAPTRRNRVKFPWSATYEADLLFLRWATEGDGPP